MPQPLHPPHLPQTVLSLVRLETPAATGAIRGTEFVATVRADGHSTIIMLDGEVEFSNAQGSVIVHSGEEVHQVEPTVKGDRFNLLLFVHY